MRSRTLCWLRCTHRKTSRRAPHLQLSSRSFESLGQLSAEGPAILWLLEKNRALENLASLLYEGAQR